MPDVDPAVYDAIDEVVEQRKGDAEWDEDEMRSALMEVAQGESQSAASEERGFSQPLLSKRWSDVQAVSEELRKQHNSESGLFRNPLEEAIEDFRAFFAEMNENYDMGIRDRAVQMMVDEIRDAGQLPIPMYLEQFLRGTNSGVQGTDVDYIRRRYESWIQNRETQPQQEQMPVGGMGKMQGGNAQQNPTPQMGMDGGVPVGGNQMGQPQQQPQQPQQGRQQPQQQMGQQPPQQQPQQPQQDDGGAQDPRVDELQQQVEQLSAAIGELMSEEEDQSQQVTIKTEDGVEMTMPIEQAAQMGYLQDDEPDFIEKLQQAKQAGVIPDPNQSEDDGRDLMETIELLKEMGVVDDGSGDEMADAIQTAISDLGEKQLQAQQQMSANLQQVMGDMKEMQQQDEEDLTLADVEEVIEQKLTKDETEQLREEMDSKFSRMMDKIEQRRSAATEGPQDPEFLKTDRQMEFREKQMQTLNENLRELPKAVATATREGLVPAMKEMQGMEGGGGSPMWSPPGQGQRGQPSYVPAEVEEANQRAAEQAQQHRAQQGGQPPQQPAPSPAESGDYPEPAVEPDAEPAEGDEEMAQEGPQAVTEEQANDLREKLNLNDDAGVQEATQ